MTENSDYKIALIRYHEQTDNTRVIRLVQKRAGVLPHLGLSYIHSALEKDGFQVKTFDVQANGWTDNNLKQELKKFKPHLTGVSSTTPGFTGALKACRIAKSIGSLTILGGPHTEVFSQENLVHPEIDFVGVGEGCTILPNLASALMKEKNIEKIDNIKGLVSRFTDGGYASMKNLMDLNWPDRSTCKENIYYSLMAHRPFATMISSRGCPFQCSFCFKQKVDKRSMFRDAVDVVDEMEYLVLEHGIKEIMFYDDVFTLKRKRVVEICNLIVERGVSVRWEAPTRADLVDFELLCLMRKAGCVRLRFGIESGDPKILTDMKKANDINGISDAVIAASRAGIRVFGYFIVGYLNETLEQYKSTVRLACDLPISYASFYTATPLPGTNLHKLSIEAGLVDPDYWENVVLSGEQRERIGVLVPDAELRAKQAFRKFYLRWKMFPVIAPMIANPKTSWAVLSGLSNLIFEENNLIRDI